MRALISSGKGVTAAKLASASKQSWRCQVVPVRLRRAIKQFLREEDVGHMKKKVLRLTDSFTQMKDFNRLLPQSVSKDLVDHPLELLPKPTSSPPSPRSSSYLSDQTAAYVASRMPSVFAACFRVLREIRRRKPDYAPSKVLDFGSGTGSAFWALREVWPHSIQHFNVIEPSQSMQRASLSLSRDLNNMPEIHSYPTLLSLCKDIYKTERKHDLVIASYVLGEIPSLKDRISTVRQLWALTRDILVLIEPGTPEGSHIISVMRSHILWMEKRKNRKRKNPSDDVSQDPKDSRDGAFIIAPCPHDGPCPLMNTGKFCHFVQRLQRTESQRAYKKSNGAPMRGFEDEKFSYVVFQRGKRPQEPWPLDDVEFETLKEKQANRKPEDLEFDAEDQFESDTDEIVPSQIPRSYDSSATETEADADAEYEDEEAEDDTGHADLGSGWGRIIFMPQKRGRRVEMDVCRATKRDGSEGSFEHLVITQNSNPTLHRQARKSLWGDLWPF